MTRQVRSSAVSLVFDSAPTSEPQLARRQVQGRGQEDRGQHPLPPTRLQIFTLHSIQPVGQLKALCTSSAGRPVHSDTNPASLGNILAMQQLHAKTIIYSHFYHCLLPDSHLYSRVNRGVVERMKMPTLRNGSKGDSNPGSLDCESGILPLSYRAPQI